MKFTVTSQELLHGILSVSKVIASKNTLPILDNFLFELSGNSLNITAADMETRLKTSLDIDEVIEEGEISIPAKLLTDSLKEFPDIPLNIETNEEDSILEIKWINGALKLPYLSAEDYPEIAKLSDNSIELTLPSDILLSAINNTFYATAEEELRPVMNGIFFDINTDSVTMVASDSHKLVYYTRNDIKGSEQTSFILPKKPASILKNLLPKVEGDVKITYDQKNAYFEFEGTMLICRLVEGKYPSYRSVIPKNNSNKLNVNRIDLLNAAKRVSVCSNQASSYVKLSLAFNNMIISAQDLSFSTSAFESVACQYDGDKMDIAFKSEFLIEILSNLPFEEVCIELSDPSRAALILAGEDTDPEEEICSLLMPIKIPV